MKAREIFIDDAGWGFPLLGVLFGVYDSQTKQVSIVKLPVKLFQSPVFEQHSYLRESGRLIGGLMHRDRHTGSAMSRAQPDFVLADRAIFDRPPEIWVTPADPLA